MITKNLSTLKIHKLTQAQYERELAAGNIDEDALYLTPDDENYLPLTGGTLSGDVVVSDERGEGTGTLQAGYLDLQFGSNYIYLSPEEQMINMGTSDESINIDCNGISVNSKVFNYPNQSGTLALTSDISDLAENLLDLTYPIGAIYLSVNSTSPASLFGGTWEQIKDRFLLAAGSTYSAGATGGSANHTLSAAQVPAVTGTISFHGKYTGNMVSGASGAFSVSSAISGKYATGSTSGTSANSVEVIAFNNGGQGKAHNNMPPYLAVYIWKRVA